MSGPTTVPSARDSVNSIIYDRQEAIQHQVNLFEDLLKPATEEDATPFKDFSFTSTGYTPSSRSRASRSEERKANDELRDLSRKLDQVLSDGDGTRGGTPAQPSSGDINTTVDDTKTNGIEVTLDADTAQAVSGPVDPTLYTEEQLSAMSPEELASPKPTVPKKKKSFGGNY